MRLAAPLNLTKFAGGVSPHAGIIACCACYAVLAFATIDGLIRDAWRGNDQGHGPIIVAVGAWLVWRRLREAAQNRETGSEVGWVILLVSLPLYAVGRSQGILALEYLSLLMIGCAAVAWLQGMAALRAIRFPLFFLLFATPLPEPLVAAITGPLRLAVSVSAAEILAAAGYEIGRTGVLLSIGPYQLLVAEACAGLNTMFTLEALGVLYMSLTPGAPLFRNIVLAALLVPIAFLANVVRVCILVLITYYLGDAAGQGFVHDFAGLVLFAVALVLLICCDGILGSFAKRDAGRPLQAIP